MDNLAAPRWVETAKVARITDTDERTVRRWCARGLIVCRRLPGHIGRWRVLLTDGWYVTAARKAA